jgi:chromosome segregation ATPase
MNADLNARGDEIVSSQSQLSEAKDAPKESSQAALQLETYQAENVSLKLATAARENELDEIQNHLHRHSSDNDFKLQALETEKNDLVQQIGDCEAKKVLVDQELNKLKAEHLDVVGNQVPKLTGEIKCLRKASNDKDVKFSALHEKYSQLVEANKKLESQIHRNLEQHLATMTAVRENFREQLAEGKSLLEQQKAELEETKRLLDEHKNDQKTELEDAKAHLVREQRAHHHTRGSLNVMTRKKNELESRIKILTCKEKTDDGLHQISAWEQFTDRGIQTDAVSDICACSDLAQKVKELQIEVRRRDCKLSNMERIAEHNPLKLDLEEAKTHLAREKRDHNRTRDSLNLMSRNMVEQKKKIEILSKNQYIPKEKTTIGTQANDEFSIVKVRTKKFHSKSLS